MEMGRLTMSIKVVTDANGNRIGLIHLLDDGGPRDHLRDPAIDHLAEQVLENLEEFGRLDTIELHYITDAPMLRLFSVLRRLRGARHIRVAGQRPSTGWGVSVWELVR